MIQFCYGKRAAPSTIVTEYTNKLEGVTLHAPEPDPPFGGDGAVSLDDDGFPDPPAGVSPDPGVSGDGVVPAGEGADGDGDGDGDVAPGAGAGDVAGDGADGVPGAGDGDVGDNSGAGDGATAGGISTDEEERSRSVKLELRIAILEFLDGVLGVAFVPIDCNSQKGSKPSHLCLQRRRCRHGSKREEKEDPRRDSRSEVSETP
ncbi:Early nodulin-like protein 2 [Senna tora]|uniref:Early nodulin-like protein 2 n=1 Tax=Senna tora TaxID=362788 RepID=A0A834X337_9FABA|nr:Early nodulin-like protein 2 [Senna tora]